jgi:hypothetical protein
MFLWLKQKWNMTNDDIDGHLEELKSYRCFRLFSMTFYNRSFPPNTLKNLQILNTRNKMKNTTPLDSVEDYARQLAKREKEDLDTPSEWVRSVFNKQSM